MIGETFCPVLRPLTSVVDATRNYTQDFRHLKTKNMFKVYEEIENFGDFGVRGRDRFENSLKDINSNVKGINFNAKSKSLSPRDVVDVENIPWPETPLEANESVWPRLDPTPSEAKNLDCEVETNRESNTSLKVTYQKSLSSASGRCKRSLAASCDEDLSLKSDCQPEVEKTEESPVVADNDKRSHEDAGNLGSDEHGDCNPNTRFVRTSENLNGTAANVRSRRTSPVQPLIIPSGADSYATFESSDLLASPCRDRQVEADEHSILQTPAGFYDRSPFMPFITIPKSFDRAAETQPPFFSTTSAIPVEERNREVASPSILIRRRLPYSSDDDFSDVAENNWLFNGDSVRQVDLMSQESIDDIKFEPSLGSSPSSIRGRSPSLDSDLCSSLPSPVINGAADGRNSLFEESLLENQTDFFQVLLKGVFGNDPTASCVKDSEVVSADESPASESASPISLEDGTPFSTPSECNEMAKSIETGQRMTLPTISHNLNPDAPDFVMSAKTPAHPHSHGLHNSRKSSTPKLVATAFYPEYRLSPETQYVYNLEAHVACGPTCYDGRHLTTANFILPYDYVFPRRVHRAAAGYLATSPAGGRVPYATTRNGGFLHPNMPHPVGCLPMQYATTPFGPVVCQLPWQPMKSRYSRRAAQANPETYPIMMPTNTFLVRP